MNKTVQALIDRMRLLLTDCPDPEAVGHFFPGYQGISFPAAIPSSYQAFLRVANGAVCGAIDLYEVKEILFKQQPVMALPGGKRRWFCIGDVLEAPLVMDVAEQTVHLVQAEDPGRAEESLGEFDYFLETCVFGADYLDLVPDGEQDAWFELTQSLRED
jgi:hypothetical protein